MGHLYGEQMVKKTNLKGKKVFQPEIGSTEIPDSLWWFSKSFGMELWSYPASIEGNAWRCLRCSICLRCASMPRVSTSPKPLSEIKLSKNVKDRLPLASLHVPLVYMASVQIDESDHFQEDLSPQSPTETPGKFWSLEKNRKEQSLGWLHLNSDRDTSPVKHS